MPKRKRTPTKKQLRALARGRAKRRRNLGIRSKKRYKPARKRVKRRRAYSSTMSSKSLTGGTADVNPQWLNGAFTMAAANTAETKTYVMPKALMMGGKGKSTIIEILKIQLFLPPYDTIANAGEVADARKIIFSTENYGSTAPTYAQDCIYFYEDSRMGAFTAAGTYGTFYPYTPPPIDVTDGAGHGILVATEFLNVQVATAGYTNPATFGWKILYRFKSVSLVEYIGLVQTQQAQLS